MPRESLPVHEGQPVAQSRPSCTQCGRTFARKEHLLRHQRSHTKESPYHCTYCQQDFRRQDVYRRHVNHFCRGRDPKASKSARNGENMRAAQACEQCRSHKVKCSGSLPCQRCITRNEACSYTRKETPANLYSIDEEVLEIHDIGVSETDDMQTESRSIGNIQASDPLESLPQPPNEGSSPSTRPSPLISSSAETFVTSSQQLAIDAHSEGSHWIDSNAFQYFDATQTGLLSPYLLNQWQQDFYEPSASLDPWLASSQYLDPFFLTFDTSISVDQYSANTSGKEANQISAPMNATFAPAQEIDDAIQARYRSSDEGSTSSVTKTHSPAWLRSLRSTIQHHDTEIVNYFLNLFRVGMAPAFPTFEPFQITENTLPDLILATAAVGGLLCTIEGSFRIARSMYTDARRLLFSRAYFMDDTRPEQAINVVQSYIALEIFGLCSGDAVSFECAEAFHMQMLQVAYKHGILNLGDSSCKDLESDQWRLLNSLFMLESYRVIFLQRPSGFHPKFTTLENDSASIRTTSQNATSSSITDFTNLLRSLLAPHLDYGIITKPLDSGFCLIYLIVLTWHTKSRSTWTIASEALWKQELVELALHKWKIKMESSVVEITPWQEMLFHLAFVNIHVDLNLILRLVRAYARGIKLDETAFTTLRSWRESNSCKVALCHAAELIEIAKAGTIFTHQSINDGVSLHITKQKVIEAPHVCAGIYMATLALWSGEMMQPTPDKSSVRSVLESGIHILSCLNIRMASLLQNILRHLVMATTNNSMQNG